MNIPSQAFELALKEHQAGNLPDAERLYLQVLRADPNHVPALNLLGLVAYQAGRLDLAARHIAEAVRRDPKFAEAHFNLGIVFKAQGKFDEAVASWRRAIEVKPDYVEALNNLGNVLLQQGQLEDAADCFRRAVKIRADAAPLHHNLAAIYKQQGKLEDAASSYRKALLYKPDFTEAYVNLGLVLADMGKLADAEANLQRAIRLQPGAAQTHVHLGVLYRAQEKWDQAIASWRRALECDADCIEAHRNLDVIFRRQGNFDDAVVSLRELIRINPEDAEALNNLGGCLQTQGKHEEAVEPFRQALALNPDAVETHTNLAAVLQKLGKVDESISHLRYVLSLRPDDADIINVLGTVLQEQGKLEEAMQHYRLALKHRPDLATAHNNLGNMLVDQWNLEDGIASYQAALRCKPDMAQAHMNLGTAYSKQGKLDEAVAAYEEALRLNPKGADVYVNLGLARQALQDLEGTAHCLREALRLAPDDALVHFNQSFFWLTCGDFERGWPEYEWRWKRKGYGPRTFDQPLWDGSPFPGRTLLLHAEQGLGDTLQFIRYAPLVKALGGEVIVESPVSLIPLLQSCAGIDRIVQARTPLPDFDTHTPLLSLPLLLGTTGLDKIPDNVPYLTADPALVEHWGRELAGNDAFKVGICWQGNPGHLGDRLRSLPLKAFASLAAIPGVSMYSLQCGQGTEQLPGDFPIVDLGSRFTSFADTAAVMQHLDLVITVDSAVAHCAGALGVPAWVLLRSAPCFRWMLKREDSPWYPSLRLFRQKQWGDWQSVFAQVEPALNPRARFRSRIRKNAGEASDARILANAATDLTDAAHTSRHFAPTQSVSQRAPEIAPPSSALRVEQLFTRATELHQAGQLKDAERLYRQILDQDPRHDGALNYLGVLALAGGAADQAAALLTEALRLDPGSAELHFNLGAARKALGNDDDAIANWRRALELNPDYVEALNNLGNALACQGKLDEAAVRLAEALRLRPGAAEGHNNLGVIFKEQGKLAEAEACYREALRYRPDFADAHSNLGLVLQEQGNLADADMAYQRAVRLRPSDADIRYNQAHLWLLQGDFQRGWPEYEWRWRRATTLRPPIDQPFWDGTPLAGRTILLYAEQGFGDALQFIRYAPLVKQLGGRVIVECPATLAPLLSRCAGVDEAFSVWGREPSGRQTPIRPVPAFDTWAPLLSLPHLLKTTPATIPADVPYLTADADLADRWASEVRGLSPLRVGISWQGNPTHPGDSLRSLPLTAFAPLAAIEGVTLLSLQQGPGVEQLRGLADGPKIIDLGSRFSTFADTAAAIVNLDLVISVDSAVAHLAGALGVPVWVVIRSAPCFRWLLGRDDTPWYPTMRLFRQARWGDWSAVLARVKQALTALAGNRTNALISPCPSPIVAPSPS